MRKLRLLIAGLLFICVNSFAKITWDSDLLSEICYGTEHEYYVRVTNDLAANLRETTIQLFKWNNGSLQHLTNESEIKGLIIGGNYQKGGGAGSSTSSQYITFKFGKHLKPGSYRIKVTTYKGAFNKPYTKDYDIDIVRIDSGTEIESLEIGHWGDKLWVCPNGSAYDFRYQNVYVDNFTWSVEGNNAEVVDGGNSDETVRTIQFNKHQSFPYKIKVKNTDEGDCVIDKELKLHADAKKEVSWNISVRDGFICKDGKTNIVEVPSFNWAESYEWELVSGEQYVSIRPSGNICYIDVKEGAKNKDQFKIKAYIYDDCYAYVTSEEIRISDIIATSSFINTSTQETIDQPVCYNSNAIPINGPRSTGSAKITSYLWSDGSTGETLNKKFASDQEVTVIVTDDRQCMRSYTFNIDVQEPENISLPIIQSCEDQEISIDLTGKVNGNITWSDGNTQKARNFVNPNYDFDAIFSVNYYDVCSQTYTQQFDFNPIPDFQEEPEKVCKESDETIIAPIGTGYSQTWENTTTGDNSTDPYYTVSNIQETTNLILTSRINGCGFTKHYTIGIKEPEEIIVEGGNDKKVCFGSDIELRVPTKFTNVNWGHTGETGNNILLENVTNNITIFVTAQNNGCIAEASITVEVLPLPSISLETEKDAYCAGERFEMELTGSAGGEGLVVDNLKMIDWSHGIDYRILNMLEFEENTEVSCRVEDENGCEATAYKNITIIEKPELDIPTQYVCEGKDITVNTGNPYSSYEWFDGSTASTLTFSDVKLPVTGAWVKVTDANQCTAREEFDVQVFDINSYYFEPIYICLGETTALNAPSGFDSYHWNNGETTRVIEVSPDDNFTYICTVTDGDCEQEITFEVIVSEPEPFAMENIFACKGENTLAPGVENYDKYAWNYNGATTQDLIFKTNNDFTLALTAWKNNCPYTAYAQVVVVEAESFNLPDKTVCDGGSITQTAPPGYSYDWSEDSEDGKQTATITPTETGYYTLTIENGYGCKATDEFLVTVNSFLDFNLPDKQICRGTTTILEVSNIYPSVLWSTGETTYQVERSPVSSEQVSATVTDINGCEGTKTANIEVLDNISISMENKSICLGEYVTIGLGDGIVYHSYLWNNGMTQSQQDVSPDETTIYSLTVEDENGCPATASIQVTVHARREISIDPVSVCENQPAEIISPNGLTGHTWNGEQTGVDVYRIDNVQHNSVVNFSAIDENGCPTYATTSINMLRNPILNIADKQMCKFETMQLHISGIYSSYNWSNGSTETFTEIVAVGDGLMWVDVTNEHGCMTREEFQLTVNEPQIIENLDNQSICLGEPVTVTLEGNWLDQTWSNGKSSKQITEFLKATTDIFVTATDLNGCEATGSMTVTVNVPEEYELPHIEMCAGDTTILTADPKFEDYEWFNGETTQSILFTSNVSQLVTVKLTDRNGCNTEARRLAIVHENPDIEMPDYYLCLGESKEISAIGGFTYLWSTGSTEQTITVNNVVDDTYTVEVTDNNGCKDVESVFVEVKPLPVVDLQSYTICPGTILNIDGGAGHNKHYWSNGVRGRFNTFEPEDDRNLTLTVEDIFGCQNTATSSIIVFDTEPLVLSPISACEGDTVSYTVDGSFPSFEWTNGATTRTITGVLANYDNIGLKVTDNNGCTQNDILEIEPLEKPVIDLKPEYLACENGSVTIDLVSGYYYTWNDGNHQNRRVFWPQTNLPYSVTATHYNGCEIEGNTIVGVSSLTNNYLEDQLACFGELVEFSLQESDNLKLIEWSTGESYRSSILVKAETDSVIKVKYEDFNGCVDSASANLLLRSGVNLYLPDRVVCKGETVTVVPNGVYESYKWSTGDTTTVLTYTALFSQVISLEVTTSDGCVYKESFNLTVNDAPDIYLKDKVQCYNDSVTVGVYPEYSEVSYLWNVGDTTSYITKNVNSNKTFILTATDRETGCSTSDTAKITVFDTPEFDIPNQFALPGESIILDVDDELSNVRWSTGETASTIVVATDTNTYLYVEGLDINSCPVIDEIFIYVAGSEKYIVESDTVCKGEACIISARSGYKEYRWNTGETGHFIITHDHNPTEYTVDITDHGGRKNTFKTYSYIKPSPDVNVGDTSVCLGSDLTINLGMNLRKILWYNGLEDEEVTFEDVQKSFSYSVYVEGLNGCSEEEHGYVSIRKNNYRIQGLKDNYKVGERLDISISSPDHIDNCTWYIDGFDYETKEYNEKLYKEGKIEILCVVQDKYGCYFEQQEFIDVAGGTSLNIHESDNWLMLYPNPVTDILNVEIGDHFNGYTINIHDSKGSLIYSEKSYGPTMSIDTRYYSEGIYILSVITKDKIFNKTIVKQ